MTPEDKEKERDLLIELIRSTVQKSTERVVTREEIEDLFFLQTHLIEDDTHEFFELNYFVEPYDRYDVLEWDIESSYEDNKRLIENPKLTYWFNKTYLESTTCHVCSAPLDRYDEVIESGTTANEDTYFDRFVLCLCSKCFYWQLFHQPLFGSRCYDDRYILNEGSDIPGKKGMLHSPHEFEIVLGKLRTFDPKIPDGCYEEIAQHLRRNPRLWHNLDPTALEKLIAAIFKANYNHCQVEHIGRPDDGGVDVVFVESEERQWLIQVKRRERPTHTEGVGTVRNLLGAMVLNDSNYGMLVSTVDQFSYRAHEAVEKIAKSGMRIKLVNKRKLDLLLDPLIQMDRRSTDWRSIVTETYEYSGAKAAEGFDRWIEKVKRYKQMINYKITDK